MKLGLKSVPAQKRSFASETEEREYLLLENSYREKTVEQKAREGLLWEEIERENARLRQAQGASDTNLKLGRRSPKAIADPETLVDPGPQQGESGKSRDVAAARSGFNCGRSYERAAKAVVLIDELKAQGKEALAEGLRRTLNSESVKAAERIVRKPEPERNEILSLIAAGRAKTAREAERKALRARQLGLIEKAEFQKGKHSVIAADPPWPYEKRTEDATHRGAIPYPSMAIEEICKLPVESLAQDDCILWLWTTNAFMEQAHQAARAWGFEVKTILTWAKDKMGNGDWLRGQTEHCLMCVKGKPIVNLTNQSTLLQGKARQHSRKPEEFYRLVEELCPGSKCELFSRESREGWASFGIEIGMFRDEEEMLQKPLSSVYENDSIPHQASSISQTDSLRIEQAETEELQAPSLESSHRRNALPSTSHRPHL